MLVINAGLAYVSTLEEMEIERFRNLQKVNVDGTLLLFSEIAKRFRHQNNPDSTETKSGKFGHRRN